MCGSQLKYTHVNNQCVIQFSGTEWIAITLGIVSSYSIVIVNVHTFPLSGFLEYQQLFSFTPSHHPLKFLPPLSLSPTLPHSFPPLISLFLFLFPFLCTPSLSLSFSLSLLTWPILSFSPFPLSLLSISPSPSLSPSPSSPGPPSLSLLFLSASYLSPFLPPFLSLSLFSSKDNSCDLRSTTISD